MISREGRNGKDPVKMFETYGITIAPRSEIARPVAPFPLSWGTKRPFRTSFGAGFA